MINKIIASYILFACFIAIAIKLADVEGNINGAIHFGEYFRSYIVQTNKELVDFKIEIPNIPKIPKIAFYDAGDFNWTVFINVLINILNILTSFINGVTTLLNLIINLLNVVIQVLEMVFIFLKNLITMRDLIVTA